MGLFALPASRIPANLLPVLLRATLLETKLVMIFLHFVASLRFKSRFLPFLVNRADALYPQTGQNVSVAHGFMSGIMGR